MCIRDRAAGALGASVAEMERRYKLFAENNVRDIKSYNKLAKQMCIRDRTKTKQFVHNAEAARPRI